MNGVEAPSSVLSVAVCLMFTELVCDVRNPVLSGCGCVSGKRLPYFIKSMYHELGSSLC